MSLKTQKNRSKSSVPLLLAAAGLVLMVLATSLILFQPPQSLAATKTPEPQHSVEETFPEISRVSLVDSKTALDNGKAIFIDVRDASSFAESHIPGALSIPLAELEERLGELDPSRWIITYCT